MGALNVPGFNVGWLSYKYSYPTGNGEVHVVALDGRLLIAPTMIYDYIVTYGYKPPQIFIDAIMNTPKGMENIYEHGYAFPKDAQMFLRTLF